MKKSTWVLAGVLLIIVGIFVFRNTVLVPTPVPENTVAPEISYTKKEVMLGNMLFRLEVADTFALQERGLSYRQSLAPQTGMLFVFDTPGMYYFWMKDMNFPIDIVWLDQNKKVVHIEHALSPSTYPDSFGPETPTQYVIEIPAGEVKGAGLSKGDVVSF
ncbi:MAG: hypothetical protein RL292_183 [Candidatus Parcubacteria bacterium]|jgi:uncharacterized membrane protein (UPF0127 family)